MLRRINLPTRNGKPRLLGKGNLKEKPGVKESALGTALQVYQTPGNVKDSISQHARSRAGQDDISLTRDGLRYAPEAGAAMWRRKQLRHLTGTTPSGNVRTLSIKGKPTVVSRHPHKMLSAPPAPKHGKILGKLGKAGRLGMMLAAVGMSNSYGDVRAGYKDRMAELRARESEAPKQENKTKEAPTTAPKPKEKTVKPAKAAAKPKISTAAKNQQVEQEPMIDPIEARKQHFQQRLSAITMAKNPPAKPTTGGAGKAIGREAAIGFLGGLLEARRIPTEKKMRKEFKSKADTTMRKGTPITHTFYSNDRQHVFRGNPLAMRQKIIAEHRRKNFQLEPDFANYDPIKVGDYFDRLSDRGMLDRDRKTLDDSMLRIGFRKAKRVIGRAMRKAKGFLTDLVTTKKETPTKKTTKESDSSFCDFAVGNVKYPHDCGCTECHMLLESSATSFGQNMRSDTTPVPNIQEIIDNNRQVVINRLLTRRKRKKRTRVKEAYEDSNRNAYIAREMQLHSKIGRGPNDVARREGTYFGTYRMLRKLDRLGMNIATAALLINGLAPAARNIKQMFSSEARGAAENVQRVFRGIPVKESGFEAEVNAAARGYAKTRPRVKEFVDAPWDTVKNAAHAYGIRGAYHVANKLIKQKEHPNLVKAGKAIRLHKYPIGKALGYGGIVGAGYLGKKLVYDPIKRRLNNRPSRLERRIKDVSDTTQKIRDVGASHNYF